jgi:hypothetical protein
MQTVAVTLAALTEFLQWKSTGCGMTRMSADVMLQTHVVQHTLSAHEEHPVATLVQSQHCIVLIVINQHTYGNCCYPLAHA